MQLVGGVFAAALAVFGVDGYTARCRSRRRQVADGAGYLLLDRHVVFFAWLFLSGDWTPEERKRLYVIGVLFLAAALFWSRLRAGRLDAEPLRRRDTRTSVFGWSFPSSWFQSMNSMFI